MQMTINFQRFSDIIICPLIQKGISVYGKNHEHSQTFLVPNYEFLNVRN